MPMTRTTSGRWVRKRAKRAMAWAALMGIIKPSGCTVVRFCGLIRRDGLELRVSLFFVDGKPIDRWEQAG